MLPCDMTCLLLPACAGKTSPPCSELFCHRIQVCPMQMQHACSRSEYACRICKFICACNLQTGFCNVSQSKHVAFGSLLVREMAQWAATVQLLLTVGVQAAVSNES